MALRSIIGLFLLVLVSIGMDAQSFDAASVSALCQEKYPDNHLVAHDAKVKYTFYKSSNKSSPITSKQESELLLNYQSTSQPLRFYESTNSFSKLKVTSAEKFDDKKNEFKPCESGLEIFAYESNGIFHNDFNVNALKIYERDKGLYKLYYSKLFSNYKFLPAISLWEDTPVLNKEVRIEIPSWLELEIIERNFDGFDIKKSKSTATDGTQILTYYWENIPSLKKYIYSPSTNHFLPHLMVVYKTIDKRGNKENLMPTTTELYGWYKSLVDQVEENSEELNELVKTFASIPRGEAQIFAVNEYVKTNIRYIAFEAGLAGFMPDASQKVFSNKYGDCKGMANLCKNILVLLGYDARLAWLGTNGDVPYDYSIPSLAVDNHMIAAVKWEEEFLFLDPTEKYGTSDLYAYRIQSRPVLIEDGESYIVSRIPASPPDVDKVTRMVYVTFDETALTKEYFVEENLVGEPKKSLLAGFNSIASENRMERLENYLRSNRTGSFEIIGVSGLENVSENLNIKYKFRTNENIINLGSEMYLDIDPNNDLENLEFEKERLSPWHFGEFYNRVTVIHFEIPDGYQLSHHPESFKIDHEYFHLSIIIENSPNTLQVTKSIQIYDGEIDLAHSSAWQEGLLRLNEYYDDRIIITKK